MKDYSFTYYAVFIDGESSDMLEYEASISDENFRKIEKYKQELPDDGEDTDEVELRDVPGMERLADRLEEEILQLELANMADNDYDEEEKEYYENTSITVLI